MLSEGVTTTDNVFALHKGTQPDAASPSLTDASTRMVQGC